MYQVTMPRLSVDMESATIAEWHKTEGDSIQKGEILFGVETDKAVIEVEASECGVLSKIFRLAGSEVPVDEVIAHILESVEKDVNTTESVSLPKREAHAEAVKATATMPSVAIASSSAGQNGERVKASPLARRIAAQKGVDFRQLDGSGPGGRIVKKDVLAAAQEARFSDASATLPEVGAGEELSATRKAIGMHMVKSLLEAPQLTLTTEFDLTNLVKARNEIVIVNEKNNEPRITYTDFLVMAIAKTLQKFPRMNARFQDDRLTTVSDVDLGIATATERGLIVPVIRQVQRKTLTEVSQEIRSLVAKARDGKCSKEEMTGGTFTVTNMGMYGINAFTPILNSPEVAILGIGRILEKPVAIDGQVCIRSMCVMSLTLDHRVVDGADGAIFLKRFRSFVEQPLTILL